MQQITKMYRSEYQGEDILLNTTLRNQTWEYEYETVPSRVENNQISNRAVIIGNGYSRKDFELIGTLQNHFGGGRGERQLQTYGCNALYREFSPHFLVATGKEITDEIAQTDYTFSKIVYTNSASLLKYPGKFYLIPQDPHWNAGTIATYLACFDGHKTIYLLGFDNSAGENLNNNMYAGTYGYAAANANYSDLYWIKSMTYIMSLYSDVDFVRVMPNANWSQPTEWRNLQNYRQIDIKSWVIEAGL